MSGVFISYRRDDCAGHAGRLYDRLVDRFGEQGVFMDIDAIEPGVDFGARIEEAVGSCRVLVVLIGDEWLHITDPRGRRRLDDPADLVRLEIAAGLRREGLRVIPVLVEGVSMPSADELPDDLKPLSRRNALELGDARWRSDVERLVEVIDRVASPAGTGRALRSLRDRAAARRRPLIALAVATVALVTAVSLLGGDGDEPPRNQPPRSPMAAVNGDLRTDARRKRVAIELVSPGGSSRKARLAPYERIALDGGPDCGYTAGIVGFCSKNGEVREVIKGYDRARPGNALIAFLPALDRHERGPSVAGLGEPFEAAWREAAEQQSFREAQHAVLETRYLEPAVKLAYDDGLGLTGQLAYYNAATRRGADRLAIVREAVFKQNVPPANGGDEIDYLKAFLNAAAADAMEAENLAAIKVIRGLVDDGNLGLDPLPR